MRQTRKDRPKRVAISLEMDWGYKRHLETYAGCQRYANEFGWNSVITPNSPRILKAEDGRVPFDGILARATEPLAETAVEMGVPLVNVWLNSPAKNVPSVLPDFEESGRMAADHLLGRGFRRFAYLGFQREKDAGSQLKGLREVLRPKGFGISTYRFSRTGLEGNAPGWEKFVAGLEKWVETWATPIGVFVGNDLYCRYLIETCRTKGLQVPQEVAIVGTSDESAICSSPYPTLTSIDMDFQRIGYRAAEALDSLMNGNPAPSASEYCLPKALIPRQSTDSRSADDPVVSKALRFIGENGQERIQVDDVVLATGINRRTLERRFRASMGRSIAEEITRLRIERSKRLMMETDASFKSLAVDLGFRNADHFCKVFGRIEKISPSQYRKREKRKG